MAAVNILSVCGSGTVTSSMVAAKLKEKLGERGYSVTTTEARPTEALNLAKIENEKKCKEAGVSEAYDFFFKN